MVFQRLVVFHMKLKNLAMTDTYFMRCGSISTRAVTNAQIATLAQNPKTHLPTRSTLLQRKKIDKLSKLIHRFKTFGVGLMLDETMLLSPCPTQPNPPHTTLTSIVTIGSRVRWMNC